MKIDDATLEDLPRIVEIYNSTIPSRMVTADLEPVTVAMRREWFARHDPRTHPCWVAREDGAVQGWLSFERFHPREAYRHTAELSIYVDPNARRRGIGRILLEEALERAPALGFHNLVGLIFSHNTPSLALFARFGFRVWGELPDVAELDGIERGLTIVGKRVGEHKNV